VKSFGKNNQFENVVTRKYNYSGRIISNPNLVTHGFNRRMEMGNEKDFGTDFEPKIPTKSCLDNTFRIANQL